MCDTRHNTHIHINASNTNTKLKINTNTNILANTNHHIRINTTVNTVIHTNANIYTNTNLNISINTPTNANNTHTLMAVNDIPLPMLTLIVFEYSSSHTANTHIHVGIVIPILIHTCIY